jgi:hypothetical protein
VRLEGVSQLRIFFIIILSLVRLILLGSAATTDLFLPAIDDGDCEANPTLCDPGSNPSLRGGKPATNDLSYDTRLN